MTVKNKKILILVFLAGCVLLGYWLWLSLRPAEVVAVHDNGNHSYVLVRSFPLTDKGKINWWLKNKDILKNNYEVPKPDTDGFFTVVFWNFGDSYKEKGKYDRLCFEDMKSPRNCIDKDKVFTVRFGRNMGLSFTTNNKIYRMKENGQIVKDESD
ncbi:DUF943 family protein [Kosakonia oryziphila]|jgi:Enterobacterial putative membrane protein (DUF943).|uniref:Putative membrane protein n=1 Tax=Kosakonia oryziphila TaxID=1005667 RepID=A0A1C4FQG1_9ENTR|nr:DUF943 family protein [Kosakonia oryziphila]SCC58054.1 putative membrane protein [Kosakonia oryziphila]